MLGDLGKLMVAKGSKSCPKSKKSPDLVTLLVTKLEAAIDNYRSPIGIPDQK